MLKIQLDHEACLASLRKECEAEKKLRKEEAITCQARDKVTTSKSVQLEQENRALEQSRVQLEQETRAVKQSRIQLEQENRALKQSNQELTLKIQNLENDNETPISQSTVNTTRKEISLEDDESSKATSTEKDSDYDSLNEDDGNHDDTQQPTGRKTLMVHCPTCDNEWICPVGSETLQSMIKAGVARNGRKQRVHVLKWNKRISFKDLNYKENSLDTLRASIQGSNGDDKSTEKKHDHMCMGVIKHTELWNSLDSISFVEVD
jgi:chromosome segregation ATPase